MCAWVHNLAVVSGGVVVGVGKSWGCGARESIRAAVSNSWRAEKQMRCVNYAAEHTENGQLRARIKILCDETLNENAAIK